MLDTKKFVTKIELENILLSEIGMVPLMWKTHDSFDDYIKIRTTDCRYVTLELLHKIDNLIENYCRIDRCGSFDSNDYMIMIYGVRD